MTLRYSMGLAAVMVAAASMPLRAQTLTPEVRSPLVTAGVKSCVAAAIERVDGALTDSILQASLRICTCAMDGVANSLTQAEVDEYSRTGSIPASVSPKVQATIQACVPNRPN